jgi:dynein heavy chain, axonemal
MNVAIVQEILKSFKSIKNCVEACNQDGLCKRLQDQLHELELCEKALADFKESKRRAFPRFYFVSSNDLLDILSNGACFTRLPVKLWCISTCRKQK